MIDAKKELLKKRPRFELTEKTGLSTGNTMLNLACTDTPYWGLIAGGFYFLWGDSQSGKTFLTMTCFAEAQVSPHFSKCEIHFINAEGGAMMDIEKFFGPKVAARLQWHDNVETIEDFYRLLWDLLVKAKKRCIIVLDSQDALVATAAMRKFAKQKKAAEEGQEAAGSMGMDKAKYHSENIRWALAALRRTGSILWVIGQSRENPNSFGYGDKKTKGGGKSLDFYANIVMQSTVGIAIKKIVRGKPRVVGSNCIVTVRKNRVTGKVGKERSAVIPIYYSYGIDDIGATIDFLIAENYLKETGVDEKRRKLYKVPEIEGFSGTRGQIISLIEEQNAYELFQDMAAKVWAEIEHECELVNRRKRYE
jgi:RecA/RadA recombinase